MQKSGAIEFVGLSICGLGFLNLLLASSPVSYLLKAVLTEVLRSLDLISNPSRDLTTRFMPKALAAEFPL